MRCWTYLTVLCLSAFTAAQAQTNKTVRKLSFDQCLELALKHNLDVQIQRLSPEMARYTLRGAYGIYDPVLSLGARETFMKSPIQLDVDKAGPDFPYELTTDTFDAQLQGQLPFGLQYGLAGTSDFLQSVTDFNLDPKDAVLFPPSGIRSTNEYIGNTAITLRQPLLRNLWIDAGRQSIQIEKKNLKISELALRQELMNVITRVQLAYFELIFAREQIRVQERAVELAQQLFAENRRRVEVGDLAPLDEKQSQSRVEMAQADLFSAQQLYIEQQNLLKTLLSDDYRAWAEVDLEPADVLVAVPMTFNRSESWATALAMRPDILQFRLELEKRNIILRYQFNQLFPNLDLVGSYGGYAAGPTFDSVADDIRDVKFPSYSYGVVLSIPLSNRAARNSYKAGKVARQQAELQLKKLEQDILAQIDTAGKLIDTYYRRVSSTRQARLFAEAALQAEQRKLQNGVSTSFIVLELQRNVTTARSSEIRALADYNKAQAQLVFSEGSTLERHRLQVDLR